MGIQIRQYKYWLANCVIIVNNNIQDNTIYKQTFIKNNINKYLNANLQKLYIYIKSNIEIRLEEKTAEMLRIMKYMPKCIKKL